MSRLSFITGTDDAWVRGTDSVLKSSPKSSPKPSQRRGRAKRPAWKKALAGKPLTGSTVKGAVRAQAKAPATNWLQALLTGRTTWEVAAHGRPTTRGRTAGAVGAEAEPVACPSCQHEFVPEAA